MAWETLPIGGPMVVFWSPNSKPHDDAPWVIVALVLLKSFYSLVNLFTFVYFPENSEFALFCSLWRICLFFEFSRKILKILYDAFMAFFS